MTRDTKSGPENSQGADRAATDVAAVGRRLPILRGAVVGALAFVAGYALTLVLARVAGGLTGARDPFGLAGLVFYSTQLVSGTVALPTGPESFNALHDITSTIPKLVYYVVPVAVLVGGGYLLVSRLAAGGDLSRRAGARAGATLVVGYLPFVAVGAVLFTTRFRLSDPFRTVVLSPDPVSAVVLAGLVYPLALGALGGYLAVAYPRDRFAGADERDRRGGVAGRDLSRGE